MRPPSLFVGARRFSGLVLAFRITCERGTLNQEKSITIDYLCQEPLLGAPCRIAEARKQSLSRCFRHARLTGGIPPPAGQTNPPRTSRISRYCRLIGQPYSFVRGAPDPRFGQSTAAAEPKRTDPYEARRRPPARRDRGCDPANRCRQASGTARFWRGSRSQRGHLCRRSRSGCCAGTLSP